jgi:hypothetical protein
MAKHGDHKELGRWLWHDVMICRRTVHTIDAFSVHT